MSYNREKNIDAILFKVGVSVEAPFDSVGIIESVNFDSLDWYPYKVKIIYSKANFYEIGSIEPFKGTQLSLYPCVDEINLKELSKHQAIIEWEKLSTLSIVKKISNVEEKFLNRLSNLIKMMEYREITDCELFVRMFIIDSNGRRKDSFTNTFGVPDISHINQNGKWTNNGVEVKEMDIDNITRYTDHLKEGDNIMVLGAAEGAEVIYLNDRFPKCNIDSYNIIDVMCDEAKLIVRNNFYSTRVDNTVLFEHTNHLKWVNQYEYIYSKYGPGYHTLFPEISFLKISSMLRKGGKAYIHFSGLVRYNMIEHLTTYLGKRGGTFKFTQEKKFMLIERI